ncbi:hypothetical protein A3Q56_05160 [Intoshia linei]|uniref:Uncharacterized protein n=1 Tax=Intoshia linei TaxID=1819745 RepID=A0A177AYL7_9BILA|nr:hypothetical protein A3Q56_05160 [Intoshia linei]
MQNISDKIIKYRSTMENGNHEDKKNSNINVTSEDEVSNDTAVDYTSEDDTTGKGLVYECNYFIG